MKLTTNLVIILLLIVANIIVWVANTDSTTAKYVQGYTQGQLDAVEGKYTRAAWEMAGMVMDEAYLEASRTADMAHRQYLHDMIESAIEQAKKDGYGW